MEDPMTIRARTRQVNVPAYYLGRPADLWISLTSSPRRYESRPRCSPSWSSPGSTSPGCCYSRTRHLTTPRPPAPTNPSGVTTLVTTGFAFTSSRG
jgi:hypothetical protein